MHRVELGGIEGGMLGEEVLLFFRLPSGSPRLRGPGGGKEPLLGAYAYTASPLRSLGLRNEVEGEVLWSAPE